MTAKIITAFKLRDLGEGGYIERAEPVTTDLIKSNQVVAAAARHDAAQLRLVLGFHQFIAEPGSSGEANTPFCRHA